MADQSNKQVVVATQPAMDRNLSTERMAFFNDDGSPLLVVDATVEPWTEATLLTGWEPLGPLGINNLETSRFYKDPTGTVWVDIYAKITEDWNYGFNTPQFTLPEGYRPDALTMRNVIWTDMATSPEVSNVMIAANGDVVFPSPPTFYFEEIQPATMAVAGGFSFRANP